MISVDQWFSACSLPSGNLWIIPERSVKIEESPSWLQLLQFITHLQWKYFTTLKIREVANPFLDIYLPLAWDIIDLFQKATDNYEGFAYVKQQMVYSG